ncbi:MAG: hypothetical protein R3237_05345 [Nitrosopumilaceae archaeon]|nr:hypothetical protein [Nitrosopumilaceae archaeon]
MSVGIFSDDYFKPYDHVFPICNLNKEIFHLYPWIKSLPYNYILCTCILQSSI